MWKLGVNVKTPGCDIALTEQKSQDSHTWVCAWCGLSPPEIQLLGVGECVSDVSINVTKIPDRSDLRQEFFSLWLRRISSPCCREGMLRGTVHDGRNTQQWEYMARAVHLVEDQEAESEVGTRGRYGLQRPSSS